MGRKLKSAEFISDKSKRDVGLLKRNQGAFRKLMEQNVLMNCKVVVISIRDDGKFAQVLTTEGIDEFGYFDGEKGVQEVMEQLSEMQNYGGEEKFVEYIGKNNYIFHSCYSSDQAKKLLSLGVIPSKITPNINPAKMKEQADKLLIENGKDPSLVGEPVCKKVVINNSITGNKGGISFITDPKNRRRKYKGNSVNAKKHEFEVKYRREAKMKREKEEADQKMIEEEERKKEEFDFQVSNASLLEIQEMLKQNIFIADSSDSTSTSMSNSNSNYSSNYSSNVNDSSWGDDSSPISLPPIMSNIDIKIEKLKNSFSTFNLGNFEFNVPQSTFGILKKIKMEKE